MQLTTGFSETEFVDSLAPGDQRPVSNEWSRVGNTIGALALRLNLMSADQVDKLLETQEACGGYFGELAVAAGYLTPGQVCQLLEIQSVHDQLFLSEQLVLQGKLDLATLFEKLAQHLRESD